MTKMPILLHTGELIMEQNLLSAGNYFIINSHKVLKNYFPKNRNTMENILSAAVQNGDLRVNRTVLLHNVKV